MAKAMPAVATKVASTSATSAVRERLTARAGATAPIGICDGGTAMGIGPTWVGIGRPGGAAGRMFW